MKKKFTKSNDRRSTSQKAEFDPEVDKLYQELAGQPEKNQNLMLKAWNIEYGKRW